MSHPEGTRLSEALQHFAELYPTARREPLKGHPVSTYMRRELPAILSGLGVFPESEYRIAGSVGKGSWAEIPWIAIYRNEETDTLHHGIFLVLVFSADLHSVHLSLNQGAVTFLDDGHTRSETNAYLLENAASIAEGMDTGSFSGGPLELDATSSVGRFLQLGNICSRRFDIDDLPTDEDWRQFLEEAEILYRHALDAKRRLGRGDSPY
ncbi:MAG: DUF3578 domain-containing protein [archaeon]|nr:DUF3578 domain-containing protein [archaeon]